MSLRRLHLIVGVLALIAFVLSGQYMDRLYDHLRGMADGPRMMYRTAHIYILWSGLLNLVTGAYLKRIADGLARHAQTLASAFLLVGPALLCISFLTESTSVELVRPAARLAIYGALAGGLLHAWIGHRLER